MSDRAARRMAWGLVIFFAVGLAVAIYFGFNPPGDAEPIRLIDALWACSFLGFPVTGALVVRRYTRRPLGWILCVAPVLLVLGLGLGDTGVASGELSREASSWFGWGANVSFSTALMLLMFVPLFLPDGQLPSPRWRIVLRVLIGVAVAWILAALFAPGPLEEFPMFTNPLGIEFLGPAFDALMRIAGPLFLGLLLVVVSSPIVRFRGSVGHERQQLKWLAFGSLVVMACFLTVPLMERTFGDLGDVVVTLVTIVAILAFPATIAISILRYRLYDIDVLINRTLVYGVLTALLLGSYLMLVVALSRILDPLRGDSDIAVAASTLAVAALFGPLRRRVQAFIDRRFYRRKYDASRALNDFGSRLRDEIELDTVRSDVLGVIGDTVQPAHASLWIKPGEAL